MIYLLTILFMLCSNGSRVRKITTSIEDSFWCWKADKAFKWASHVVYCCSTTTWMWS